MGNLDRVFIRAYTKQSRQAAGEGVSASSDPAPVAEQPAPAVAPTEAPQLTGQAKETVSASADRPWLRIDHQHSSGGGSPLAGPHPRGPSQSEGGVRVDRRPPPVNSDHCEPSDLAAISDESGLGTLRFRHAPHRLPPYPHLNAPTAPAHEPVGAPTESGQPSLRRTLSAYLQLARQVQLADTSDATSELPLTTSPASTAGAPSFDGGPVNLPERVDQTAVGLSPAASAVAASLVAAPPARPTRSDQERLEPVSQPASPLPPPNLRGWGRPPAQVDGRPHHLPVPSPELSEPEAPQKSAGSAPSAQDPSLAVETQRRSLPFQAVWEVDAILWPDSIYRLCSQEQRLLEAIGERLAATVDAGLRVLAVTSGDRGEGRTTVAACLAHSGSLLGMRVALVDGDLERPTLSEHLNLEVSSGWLDAIASGIPVEEVAVHSIEDQVTLVPLKPASGSPRLHPQDERIQQLIQRLADGFDLVIIDAGQINAVGGQLVGSGADTPIDAAVLVVDHRRMETKRIESAAQRIRRMGIESIGLVENFRDDR
jgi:Mrp family chromosome partitioning ATPase